MGEKQKEKASNRRRWTEGEGRESAGNEPGQGTTRGRQQEKIEEVESERAKEERLMREQGKGKDQKKRTSSRVGRREVRIPKDQQALLNREEFLLSDGTIVLGKEVMPKNRLPSPPPAGKYDALGI